MASRILLLDGNSLIHRAYHALPLLSTTAGQPTNAAFGFVSMVLNMLQAEQPAIALLVLDAPGPTFRHDLDADYKAHRKPMDEELASQLGLCRELGEAMGLTVTDLPGFEADDIIGALARQAAAAGSEVLVVSGDRDLAQLVGPGVQLCATIKGFKDTKIYDAAAVREEFGVAPEQLADLKGLAGDSSDNISGVPKVGPKTAQELIAQFGSVEGIYERLEDVANEKLRERLREHEEVARRSKRLAVIATDAPLQAGLLDRPWPGLQGRRLRRLLGELEFTSLLSRVPGEVAEGKRMAAVDSPQALEELCSGAREAGVVGVAVAQRDGVATAVALSLDDEHAQVVPLGAPTAAVGGLFGEAAESAVPGCLAEVLADPAVGKIGHGLKEMDAALRAAGASLDGFFFDTQLAAYLVAPNRGSQEAEAPAAQYLGEALPAGDGPGVDGLAGPQARAAFEAAAARRLQRPLLEHLEAVGARDLFEQVEMPLAAILRDMERCGIALDPHRLEEIGDKLAGMMLEKRAQVLALAGTEFNLDSPKQTSEVLFERLHLPRGRKTATGWSTSADVLEDLAAEHEIVARILEYREYAKLKSTYVDALTRQASPRDGRVRTTFEQTVVATGRLSSRNPNLQNIPARTEWGREIRSCFVAQGEENVLLAADYSQIELRILAHMSQDENLTAAFHAHQDIHSRSAAAIFGVEPSAVSREMRNAAKTVNYAVIYGMGSAALARQLGIKRPQAQQFIDSYFTHLPRVKAYMEGVVARGREEGYVTTLLGRRRPVPELSSTDQRARAYAERAAANAPLQGSAADIIKVAMVHLAARLPQVAPGCKMLLQVHDELVFELPRSELDGAAALIREVMERAAELSVPLVVDLKAGPNWRDMAHL